MEEQYYKITYKNQFEENSKEQYLYIQESAVHIEELLSYLISQVVIVKVEKVLKSQIVI